MAERIAFIPVGVDPPVPLVAADVDRLAAFQVSRADVIGRLDSLGLQFDRTTCPDLASQLMQSANRPIDFVVCNALDAEPNARLNGLTLAQFPHEVMAGVKILLRATGAPRSQIVVDSAGPRASLPLKRGEDKLIPIESAYPLMHPSLLLSRLFKRQLAPGRLPIERGVLMVDPPAAFVIGRMFSGNSTIALPVLLRDDRVNKATAAMTGPEIKLSELLGAAGISLDQRTLIVSGEKLRRRRAELDTMAAKLDPLIHICPAEAPAPAEACVRCNWCADVCPVSVLPMLVLEAAQTNDGSLADRAGARRCIDCGLCDYVCPSRLPLMSAIRHALSS